MIIFLVYDLYIFMRYFKPIFRHPAFFRRVAVFIIRFAIFYYFYFGVDAPLFLLLEKKFFIHTHM